MKRWVAGLMFTVAGTIAGPVLAEAPAGSIRPEMRPGMVQALDATRTGDNTRSPETTRAVVLALATLPPVGPGLARSPLPVPRPNSAPVTEPPHLPVVAAKPARVVLASAGNAVRVSPRPDIRPDNLKRQFMVRAAGVRSQPSAPVVAGPKGAVCGDNAIKGQALSPIAGRLAGCGVANPVRITSVDGVTLSTPATLNCRSATALKRWVTGTVKPAVGRLGGGVASLKVAAHYSCRTRNNVRGARVSEHGKGNAIDISAIVLKNGVALTVLKGWGDKVQGKILKAVHRNACGPFKTVLGPNADRYHQDHIHLDVAQHRGGGAYCR